MLYIFYLMISNKRWKCRYRCRFKQRRQTNSNLL